LTLDNTDKHGKAYAGLSAVFAPLVLVEILLPLFFCWLNEEENVVGNVQQQTAVAKPE